jgi:hypothetical protein
MKAKAIHINSAERTITEVEIEGGSLKDLQALTGGGIEIAWSFQNGDVLFVDDEGLLKPQEHYFRISTRKDGQPLAGNAVLVGREVEGPQYPEGYTTLPPQTSVAELESMITFYTKDQVMAWATGNASEPWATFQALKPDMTPDGPPVVLSTTGGFFGVSPPPKKP